jgi:hypothetical protein
MKLTAAIESLELDLTCIEHELQRYYPPICKYDAIVKDLLKNRKEIESAIEILKKHENN